MNFEASFSSYDLARCLPSPSSFNTRAPPHPTHHSDFYGNYFQKIHLSSWLMGLPQVGFQYRTIISLFVFLYIMFGLGEELEAGWPYILQHACNIQAIGNHWITYTILLRFVQFDSYINLQISFGLFSQSPNSYFISSLIFRVLFCLRDFHKPLSVYHLARARSGLSIYTSVDIRLL